MDKLDLTPLIASICRRDQLSESEKALLVAGPWRTRDFRAEQEIVERYSKPTEACLILEGITGRSIDFQDGRRQITSLHLMGDFVDLHSMFLPVMDHNVVALTPVRVAYIRHDALRNITEKEPHLGRLLAMLIAIDGAIERSWIACLGRRSSEAHLAHLFCELYLRLQVVGLTRGNQYDFPIAQTVLADVVGLSTVHVNRTLQVLRGLDLLEMSKQTVTIKNWKELARFAEFDEAFLNLMSERR